MLMAKAQSGSDCHGWGSAPTSSGCLPNHPPVAGDATLVPASLIQRRITMAKGQQRGNREAKKPKKEKPKVAATAQASFGLAPPKSTGAKDDRGKKK
jgi:hypothetical protein